MNREKHSDKGFTYTELVLALAIIAFIVLAFSQLFLRTSVIVKNTQFQTLAYSLAGDKVEEIKTLPFESIGNPWFPNVWQSDSETLSGRTFTRQVTVSQLESTLKRVDVRVIWTEQGEAKDIRVVTLITEK